MPGHPTCTWTGKSGKKYIYEVHPRHPKLAPHEPGNFIYAKRDARHHWVPICIGEGDLTQRARAVPGCLAEIDSKGATHVHVHVGYDRGDREAEMNDLLAAFPDAFAPAGWVERAGR